MKTIDAKASTHFCESPITQAEIEEKVAFTSVSLLDHDSRRDAGKDAPGRGRGGDPGPFVGEYLRIQ